MKRIVDIVVGGALAIAVTPLVIILAVVVAFVLQTTPFFVQERIGRHGRPFRIVKLRTLPRSVPRYATKRELAFDSVPHFTRLLRDLHFDELPQLWLVPLGRMSLVGPRPEMEFLLQPLPESARHQRLQLRPGCTGLWQISVDQSGLIHEHPEYDLLYAARRSARLDLWIFGHTLLKLLGRARPVTMADAREVANDGYRRISRHFAEM